MKTFMLLVLFATAPLLVSHAQIKRIEEGGQHVQLSDVMTPDEPAVFVFFTPWDQDSLNLLNDVESWSSDYPDLDIFFVDCVDQRTQVYNQFNLNKIPSIVVYDKDEEKTGFTVYTVDELETLLKENDLLD